MISTVEDILNLIDEAHNIVLVCHRNPDADSLGSATAMAFFLEAAHKNVDIYCQDAVPPNLEFMGTNKFCLEQRPRFETYELLITLDCADLEQATLAGEIEELKRKIKTVNLDHHKTNKGFAQYNLIDLKASSTAEVVYQIIKKRVSHLTKEMSTAILTGLMYDTTFLSNGLTSNKAVKIVAELLSQGANMKAVVKNLWKRHTPETLKLWGKLMTNLHHNEKLGTVVAIVSRDLQMIPGIFKGFSNFLTNLYDVKMTVVLFQNENSVGCSMRSLSPEVDVLKIAQAYGGGGHPKAAGFEVAGGRIVVDEMGWKII